MTAAILIVDDEFGLADIVADVLSESGYEVAIAINGKLGLAKLAEKHYDLVLLDVMMPVLDGKAMLRQMRATPELERIPVIMMTALPEALPRDTPRLHQGELLKPFSPERLFEVVEAALKGRPS